MLGSYGGSVYYSLCDFGTFPNEELALLLNDGSVGEDEMSESTETKRRESNTE